MKDMETGFYARRVTEDRITDIQIDESACADFQTNRMFSERDKRMQEAQADRDLQDRKAAKLEKAQQIRKNRMIRDCIHYAAVGVAGAAAYFGGPAVLGAILVLAFGAICWRLGK